jgi:hypothetical protein
MSVSKPVEVKRRDGLARVGNGRENEAYVNKRQVVVLKMRVWYIKYNLSKINATYLSFMVTF